MAGALLLALALAAAGTDPAPTPAPASQEVEVAILAHDVAKGDALGPGDFDYEMRSPSLARGAVSVDDTTGMEASRPMRAGSIVRRSDLTTVKLVRRGEPVAIRIISGPLTIATSGRALADGAKGDLVRVVTASTNRTLDAVVDGTGSVRLMTP